MVSYLKNFVELRTKVASVFPFFYVLLVYLVYYSNQYQFKPELAIVFFISMLSLDMATTALNHLAGLNKEEDISLYDQQLQKSMNKLGINNNTNWAIFLILAFIGIGLGGYLVLSSNIYVLLLGAFCVFIALIYSYGPLPLKNTCLGEVASGFTMGAIIPIAFLCIQDLSLFLKDNNLFAFDFYLYNMYCWALILLIPVLLIAAIMLANNICDIDKDIVNGRKTLPILIGQQNGLRLWNGLYFTSYIILVLLVILDIFNPIMLLGLVTIPVVLKNCKKLNEIPVKAKSFKYVVFNLQIILGSLIVLLLISYIV